MRRHSGSSRCLFRLCPLQSAQHSDDLAEYFGIVAENRLEGAVARQQPGVAIALAEHLHGGLAVQHRSHDVTVFRGLLLAYDHPVAVADGRIDHRVSDDLEHEQLALADELTGEREYLFDLLFGRDRNTGGDASHERHHGCVPDRRGIVGLRDVCIAAWQVDQYFESTGTIGVPTQVTAEFELVELVGHARQGGEPDGVTDLAHAGRIPSPGDRALDELKNGLLLVTQALAPPGRAPGCWRIARRALVHRMAPHQR